MTQPFVTTFYSYKGGVGRTLLAANIGVILSRSGKTLLWDLDIEAPGMQHIRGLRPESAIKFGFFEWLIQWQDSKTPAAQADFAALTQLCRPCPDASQLYILPAFADGANFAALYQQIRWEDFLAKDPDSGLALFRGAIAALSEAGFDTLLLEARTGITDIGGLLAALLPHATVLVGNFSKQNTMGLSSVWRALRPAQEDKNPLRKQLDMQPLRTLLVVSPIPSDDTTLIEAGEKVWAEAFEFRQLPITPTIHRIPWADHLLFAEELLAATTPDAHTAVAYQTVAEALALLQADFRHSLSDAAANQTAYADLLPDGRRNTVRQGKTFEEKVAHLLRLLGYQVEQEQLVDSNRVDLIARKRGDFGREDVYLIECKDHQKSIPKETVQILKTWLEGPTARQWQARGMLIAARDFAPAARSYAREQDIRALSYDELERSLFDFSPYLARLRQRFEASPLAHTYVAQLVRPDGSRDEQTTALLPRAQAWAKGEGPRLWLVLGDYGTGKSAFIERFAFELAKACEDDRDAPVPLAINLKYFPNAISLESLIREHLENELRSVLNPEIVLHLLEAGRLLLLLDSFDEMGVAQVGRSIEEQFRKLVQPTAGSGSSQRGNRILITSRRHFFRDQQAVQRTTQGHTDTLFEPESPLGQVARSFDARIDELPPFTEAQIQEYLQRRLGQVEGAQAWQRIGEIYGLRELASTPQLLDIIVTALPDLAKGGGAITPAALYLGYTNRWLEQARLARAEVTVEHLRELLENLACELWRRPQNRIHYAELARLLRDNPQLARQLDSERVDLELRTAAFLVRSPDGYYRFSHRSFLEFFFARALYRSLKGDALDQGLARGRPNREAMDFFLDMVGEQDETRLCAATQAILSAPYRTGISENTLILAHYTAMRGVRAISTDGIQTMLYSRQQKLLPKGAQLGGAQLAELELSGVWLPEAQLQGANLSGTHLKGANLRGADLSEAALEWADLSYAHMEDAKLPRVQALDVRTRQTHLAGADCEAADFHAADLRELDAPRIKLSRATWPHSHGLPPGHDVPPTTLRPHLATHLGLLTACAFSPDGQRVITASFDNTVRIWDASSGKQLLTLEGHPNALTACAFSSDGQRVITVSGDSTARIWDTNSGKTLFTLESHQNYIFACAFSPDGQHVITASDDSTACVWNAHSGKAILTLQGHRGALTACAFSPDGLRVITASHDNTACIWDAHSGKAILTLQGHRDALTTCAFSPDGLRVITASDDSTACIWDAHSGKAILTLQGHRDALTACSFSPDGQHVITASFDDTVRIWDARSGEALLALHGHQNALTACAFSPDGLRIITASFDNTVRIWDASSGKQLLTLEGHPNALTACAFSSDGLRVVTASFDDTVRIWDARSGNQILALEGRQNYIFACAFSPDGQRVIAASFDNTARIWNARSGKPLLTLEGHQSVLNACAFSPDGLLAITTSDDGTARIWDTHSGKPLLTLEGHQSALKDCAFSPDGLRVITASFDDTARIWDTSSGKPLLTLEGHQAALTACAFSPNGLRVITASFDNTARIWDASSGKPLLTLEGHPNALTACAFSPDGRHAITASNDSTMRIWDAASGKQLRILLYAGPGWLTWDDERWDGEGELTEKLMYVDPDEQPPADGADDWLPTLWHATDLPERKGLKPLEIGEPIPVPAP